MNIMQESFPVADANKSIFQIDPAVSYRLDLRSLQDHPCFHRVDDRIIMASFLILCN